MHRGRITWEVLSQITHKKVILRTCTKTWTRTTIMLNINTMHLTIMEVTKWTFQNSMMTLQCANGNGWYLKKMLMMKSAKSTLKKMETHLWFTIKSSILQEQGMQWLNMVAFSTYLQVLILIAEPTICTNSTQRPSNGIRSSKQQAIVTSITRWTKSKSQWTNVGQTNATSLWMTKQSKL